MALTNRELWDKTRDSFPNFKSHTSKGTADMFTEKGFESIQRTDPQALSDFWELTLRVYLQKINVSHTADPLEEKDFGEYYDMPYGAYNQRLAIESVKPVSPAYKNIENYSSVDPFVVKKNEIKERFFNQNFDYQALITMPDEFEYKQIFISEFGMSETQGAMMQALQNGYTNQVFVNKLEAINAGINSTVHPLKETQKVVSALTDGGTEDEMKQFIMAVNNIVEAMSDFTETDAFNAASFSTKQDKARLKLLVRPTFKNRLKALTLAGIFHPDKLNFDVDLITVPHFGGLIPQNASGETLYPVYDKLGTQIGYNTVAGATEVTVKNDEVVYVDPNANVNAILADKGIIFHSRQNDYTVEPIRNPRGRYTNYWASSPNNGINYDYLYNVVLFTNS